VKLKTLGVYYYRPQLPGPPASRSEFGLPETKHLYGCLQSLFKIHPEFDALLGGILRQDPLGEIVFLEGSHPNWSRLLMKRFSRTIPGEVDRIRFVPRQSYADYLRLNTLFDVLLDPLHYSGGNTSYEALSFGVPIVTLPSPYLRGRITDGLYRKMGLSEFIAADAEEYVDTAVRLGTDDETRRRWREEILGNADRLFEEIEAVREFELFLRTAVENERTERQ
jgi:predicted O-linked N-acetylglucosamine transferase (SPINDLY family)